jgi:hypothetical protein
VVFALQDENTPEQESPDREPCRSREFGAEFSWGFQIETDDHAVAME